MRLTADSSRKKRETEALQLRDKRREDVLIKRRNLDANIVATPIADIAQGVRIYHIIFQPQIASHKAKIEI